MGQMIHRGPRRSNRFGELCAVRRDAVGISLRSLARDIDLAGSFLSRIESGDPKAGVSGPTVEKLCKALNIDLLEGQLLALLDFAPDPAASFLECALSEWRVFKELFSGEQISEIVARMTEKIKRFDVSKDVASGTVIRTLEQLAQLRLDAERQQSTVAQIRIALGDPAWNVLNALLQSGNLAPVTAMLEGMTRFVTLEKPKQTAK